TTETPDPGTKAGSAAPVPEQSDDTPDDVATQDDSPVVQAKPEKPVPKSRPEAKPKPKPAEKPKEPTIDRKLAEALSNWGQTAGSSGQGDSQTPGNEGVRDGKPDGIGTFHGDGWAVNLGGRGLMKGPSITDKPNEGGKVVLDIFVDRNGKVTRVNFNLG